MAIDTLSLGPEVPPATVARLNWRAVAGALRGDALAAFPVAAFEEDVVVQSFLGRRHILFQDPDAIRHILVENPQNYARIPAVYRVLRPIFGRGLFLSTGKDWREQRRVVAPAFAPRVVQLLAREVVTHADALVAELAAADGPVNLVPRLQRLALDIIGSAVFSLDMSRYAPELRELILHYAARLGRASLADLLLPLAVRTPADLARSCFRRRWRRLIRQVIAARAARPRDAAEPDLFDILAASDPATGTARDAELLADQVATIVVAGHETTAAALFWTLYLLARHPAEQERLAGEFAGVTLTAANAGETLPLLGYTRAVVDEALRLYPPAYVIVRQAQGRDVAAGIEVPKGSMVLVAPYVLHRHRRYWPAPDRFDPARFLPGAARPPRFVYMPFGAGPRVCVGAPFALTELVLLTAAIVRHFHIEPASPLPVRPLGSVTIQPASPPFFHLRKRSG